MGAGFAAAGGLSYPQLATCTPEDEQTGEDAGLTKEAVAEASSLLLLKV